MNIDQRQTFRRENPKSYVTVKKEYSPDAQRIMTDKELIDLEITLPKKRSALVIQYRWNR